MKITFEEIVGKKEWIHRVILNSITQDIIESAKEDRFYDVKLFLNGKEVDIKLLDHIFNNIETYIEEKAKELVQQKFDKVEEDLNQISELFHEAKQEMKDKYNLHWLDKD